MKRTDKILIFALTALVVFLRKGDVFFHAQFWAEDSFIYFNDAYHHGLSAIFWPYSGYLHVFPRIWASVAEIFRLPLSYIPLWYSLAWWLWWGILVREISRTRILSRSSQIFLALSLVIFPVASESLVNLCNVHWLMAMWLILVLIRWSGSNRISAWIIPGILLAGLSGPHTIILLPFLAAIVYLRKKYANKSFWAPVLVWVGTAICQVFFLMQENQLSRNRSSQAIFFSDYLALPGKLASCLIFPEVNSYILDVVLGTLMLVSLISCCIIYRKDARGWVALAFLLFVGTLCTVMKNSVMEMEPVLSWGRYFYVLLFIGIIWLMLFIRSERLRYVCMACLIIPGLFFPSRYEALKLEEYPLEKLNAAFRHVPFLIVPANPAGFNLILDDMKNYPDSANFPLLYNNAFSYNFDKVTDLPDEMTFSGWVCPGQPGEFTHSLVVLFPFDTVRIESLPVLRPDVAEALGNPSCEQGGFNFILLRNYFPYGIFPLFLEVRRGNEVYWKKLDYTFTHLPKVLEQK